MENVTIPRNHIASAVQYLLAELGPKGVAAVGGGEWWQWRPEDQPLMAEWVEMRRDYDARKIGKKDCTRSMLYVHGEAT